ncbi:PLDc N-terminal domain-containing protein [Belliella pelovolcani]|uniref:PLDc N-terminal domain-containing protein n=1 Tax=Belliella pelovolcani TaxID=529505 RepID=UPI00391BF5E0
MELIERFGIQYWVLILVVLYGVLWLWCLMDLIKSEFTDNSIKALWLLLLVFLNPLAPFLYGHFARKQKLRMR